MHSVSRVAPALPCHEIDRERCVICLEDLVTEVVRTRCGHRLHANCAVMLLQGKQLEERKCAICRQKAEPLQRDSGPLLCEESPLLESLTHQVCRLGDNRRLEEFIAGHPIIVHLKPHNGFDNYTLLYQASVHGQLDCLNTLIRAGTNVDRVMTSENLSALFAATSAGHLSCLTALIRAGANLELATASRRSTALCVASEMGNADCVEALIASRANVDATEIDGARPLHLAAQKGH